MITMCFGSFETAEAKEKDKVLDVLKCTGDYIYSKVKEPLGKSEKVKEAVISESGDMHRCYLYTVPVKRRW